MIWSGLSKYNAVGRCGSLHFFRQHWPPCGKGPHADNLPSTNPVFQLPHDAVIRVYDGAGNVIETHEHKGDFKEW